MVGRIEFCHSVVVPQHPVASVREVHRQGNLCVHLCQSACEAAHVGLSVLKLSQSE